MAGRPLFATEDVRLVDGAVAGNRTRDTVIGPVGVLEIHKSLFLRGY